MEQLVAFIRNNNYSNQAGIVYAFSRKEASDVAAGLASRGIPAAFYHAGQEVKKRRFRLVDFSRASFSTVIAS